MLRERSGSWFDEGSTKIPSMGIFFSPFRFDLFSQMVAFGGLIDSNKVEGTKKREGNGKRVDFKLLF